jgi:hypothetical protein
VKVVFVVVTVILGGLAVLIGKCIEKGKGGGTDDEYLSHSKNVNKKQEKRRGSARRKSG